MHPVQLKAATLLGAALDTDRVPAALYALCEAASPLVRASALTALAGLRDRRAVEVMLDGLAAPESEVQSAALAALAAHRWPEALGLFRQLALEATGRRAAIAVEQIARVAPEVEALDALHAIAASGGPVAAEARRAFEGTCPAELRPLFGGESAPV